MCIEEKNICFYQEIKKKKIDIEEVYFTFRGENDWSKMEKELMIDKKRKREEIK